MEECILPNAEKAWSLWSFWSVKYPVSLSGKAVSILDANVQY